MSDTDKPIMTPAPGQLVIDGNSLMRFRCAFSSLSVFDGRDGGRRLEVCEDGHRIVFDLDQIQARHVADLLTAGAPLADGAAS